jgi:hypothetical protein
MLLVQDVLEPAYRKSVRWGYKIVGLRERASYVVALTCTYLKGVQPTLTNARERVNVIKKLWIERLWDLGRHELWLYQRGLLPNPDAIEPKKLLKAFRLHVNCRPRCIVYMPPREEWQRNVEYKPCNRANFCPHCWASVSARQTQRVKQLINACVAADANAKLTLDLQVTEYFLSSGNIGGINFVTPEEMYSGIVRLRDEFKKHKKHLAAIYPRVRRNTIGSVWRSVVIPAEHGWRIQFRQLFLSEKPKRPPLDVMRGARRVVNKTVNISGGHTWKERQTKLTMDDNIYGLLIAFNDYPLELLTEDLELTAIYLNAAAKVRLLGGSGKLHRIGGSLVREFVRQETASKNANAR